MINISRILHAGYLFESEIDGQNTKIVFDPIFENPFSRNCYSFPKVTFDITAIRNLELTAIFISHIHDDHCSLESLDLLDKSIPIYIYCHSEKTISLIRELGFLEVNTLNINETIEVGEFKVTTRRALDHDIDSIFHIQFQDLNILNVVDSWIDYQTLDLLLRETWDLVLWPFQTMREVEVLSPSRAGKAIRELPPEWIEQLSRLRPKYVIPSSCQFIHEEWSWYNRALFPISYMQFHNQMATALPEAQVIRLNPSDSRRLTKTDFIVSEALTWVQVEGEPNVDYDFEDNMVPPTTSEVSKHFAALTPQQTEFVYEYCKVLLVSTFEKLEPTQDKYFEIPKKWQLTIYDHLGYSKNFLFLVDLNKMRFLESSDPLNKMSLGWRTEVSIAKLFAALELGETLTSMYLRINDQSFDLDIEAKLQELDPLNDPLVRCLFNSNLATYHDVQIQEIRKKKRLGLRAD